MKARISVIVPVYNVEQYLSECVESLVSQTFQELEIILVDDGSSDQSGRLCDAWAGRDARIRVIHKGNGGVSSARNEGLRACTGAYIGFVDADDWCEPEMYEVLAGTMNGVDAAACGFVEYPMDSLDFAIHIGRRKAPACTAEDAAVYLYERDGYFTSVWNKLFRREVVFPDGKMIAMDTTLAFGEDELWLAEVLGHCRRLSFVPEALYHWRPRAGSASRAERVTDRQMTVLAAKKRALEALPQQERVQRVARARIYNDCISLKVQTYCAGDRERLDAVSAAIAPMRKAWLLSPEIRWLRKCKVLLIEAAMALRMPEKWVRMLDNVRRFGIRR